MSETTLIQPDKIRAYLATDYRLGHSDADIVLKIGVQSPDLAELFAVRGVECGMDVSVSLPPAPHVAPARTQTTCRAATG